MLCGIKASSDDLSEENRHGPIFMVTLLFTLFGTSYVYPIPLKYDLCNALTVFPRNRLGCNLIVRNTILKVPLVVVGRTTAHSLINS